MGWARKWVPLVLTFAVGGLTGWWIRGAEHPAPVAPVAETPAIAPAVAVPTIEKASRAPAAAPAAAVEQLRLAQARVVDLEQRLESERKMREWSEGAPVPWPADAGERFRGDALRSRLSGVIRSGKLDMKISALDCTEFPCIIWGEVTSSRELWKSVFDGMEEDSSDINEFMTWKVDGGEKDSFVLTRYPSSFANDKLFEMRVSFRMDQMKRSTLP